MSTKLFNVRLTDEDFKTIDRRVFKTGMTRSEVVRELVRNLAREQSGKSLIPQQASS
ncbi:MAG: hypothetical protein C5B44_01415 [Acidobacteria bacterium]|nr:MAG: hypothetical protein C5B44_01415 [Acidobacteriota bacterium]